MQVVKGKNGGFCFGVKRAIDKAEELAEKNIGKNVYVLGDLIHNELVINELKDKNIFSLDNLDRLNFGDTLLIRTHGEPKNTFQLAEQKGLIVEDCTCPFVKEIQKIVEKHYNDGYKIVIVGKASHPEVVGINGWCNNSALISEDPNEINRITDDKICIVVQTTYSEEKFDNLIKKIDRKGSKIVDIFKTICYTTTKRQKEAEIIAKSCDAVLVIGGNNSNNTKKLFEIVSKYCKNVFNINDADLFDCEKIKNFNKVGIVLGASTPISQFQKVIKNMENITEEITVSEINTEEQMVEKPAKAENVTTKSEMEKAFNNIKPNKDFTIGKSIVNAKISSVSDTGLTISLNSSKSDFVIPVEELLNQYTVEDIGKSIRVMVVGKNPLKFSEKKMEKVLKEEAEIEEIKNGKIFEVVIKEANKGGLTGKFGSFDVFVPASQIRIGFVKDLEKYVGKTLKLKAEKVEARGSRRQIVGSQRVILEAEKAEKEAAQKALEDEFFSVVQEGDVVIGTPVRFTAFGAFIDVNGFDCLCHISDLSWTGCKQCSDILELNKSYEFKVLKLDVDKKRVSVGYKQLQAKPWDTVFERYAVGDTIKGKVVRIVPFGAFVEVEKGIDGLVHVSQISNQWLENPVTALTVGQEVDAKIIEINPEKEKMTLSIKALLPEEPAPVEEEKKGKGKKSSKKEEIEEPEIREWKEESNGVSIAEMINK